MKMMKLMKLFLIILLTIAQTEALAIENNSSRNVPDISANAKIPKKHQPVNPKITCSECHNVKYDAESTATKMWLNNHKLLSQDEIWKWIVDFLPNRERFVIATVGKNFIPTSSTVDFVLIPEKKIFLSVNEKGTEKILQLKENPWISMTHYIGSIEGSKAPKRRFWKSVQVLGKAEVLEPQMPEFEDMLELYNPARTSIEQSLKRFNMLKVKIKRIIVFDSDNLEKGYSPYQLWENKNFE